MSDTDYVKELRTAARHYRDHHLSNAADEFERMEQRIEELESQLATVEKSRDNWDQRCGQALTDRDEMENRLKELESKILNIQKVYETIDLNACAMEPGKLFELTDAIYTTKPETKHHPKPYFREWICGCGTIRSIPYGASLESWVGHPVGMECEHCKKETAHIPLREHNYLKQVKKHLEFVNNWNQVVEDRVAKRIEELEAERTTIAMKAIASDREKIIEAVKAVIDDAFVMKMSRVASVKTKAQERIDTLRKILAMLEGERDEL